MPRKRYPDEIVVRVDSLIRKVAEIQRKNDPVYEERGITNSALVTACLGEAREIMRRQYDEMVSGYLSLRIPQVLPSPSPTERTSFLTLPGLDLPAWLAIPPEDKGDFGWKYQPDVTPNQLDRVIEHRTKEIDGRLVEKNKLVLLRATAIERGCDPDERIGNVFGDWSGKDIPGDEPRPPGP